MGNKFDEAIKKRNNEIKEENKESIVKEKQQDNIELNINNLFVDNDKKSKNKTFYLEEKVISMLEKTAKKQKVSDSKFLNELLKHVFKI